MVSTPGSIPPPVQQSVMLPRPRPAGKTETYSVVVNNVPLAQGVTTDSIGEDLGRISSLLYDAY